MTELGSEPREAATVGTRADDRAGAGQVPDLRDPALYVNRELSWLDFNDRVLQLAEDESLPLIERLKFLAIFVTNLDEFFMIRVAGVHDQVDARIDARGPDGLSPAEVLRAIHDTRPRAGPRATREQFSRGGPARAGRAGRPDRQLRRVRRVRRDDRAPLPRADLPGADAAGGRRRPRRSPTSPTCRCA